MSRAKVSLVPVATGPRMRRAYFENSFGQLHVHDAIPAGGGFDEATTLLCFHPSPMSGRLFRRLLALMGRDRSVYAPDTPGCGESDGPPRLPALADYAQAMAEFLDTMRFRKVDVFGYHTGSLIATELALVRPDIVRRVVLVGVPVLSEAERAQFGSAPFPPGDEWKAAIGGYPARERLALLRQPVLVLRPKDDLWETTLRAKPLLKDARFVDLPEHGSGLFEVAADVIAGHIQRFLGSGPPE